MTRRSAVLVGALWAFAPSTAAAATVNVEAGALRLQSAGVQSDDFQLLPSTGGSYLVRRSAESAAHLTPGAGCKLNRPRELRCAGAIDRIEVALGDGPSSFVTERLAVPIAIDGGGGNDGIRIGGLMGRPYGSSASVVVDTGSGRDSVSILGLPGVSYVVDGGPGADTLSGRKPFDSDGAPAFTLRGGDGNDTITGAAASDDLEGGAGRDAITGNGGTDTLLGGPGTDTVIFTSPSPAEPRLSVTLDGQPNDGQPGENALVGSDVENVTFETPFEGGPVPGGNTLIGDDGPNVLIGAGTVRGLGGDDIVVGASAEPNDLDGGDGDDRVGARVHDENSNYRVADKIACGNGDDTAFTDALDPRPADCERFNIGLHVAAATAKVGSDGRAAVRVSCDDIVPCDLGNVVLLYKNHVASEYSGRPRLTVAPGRSAVRRVLLNRWLRRPGRFRTLTVTATPGASRVGQPGEVTAGFPRLIKLIRAS